jgi:hydantoinase/carbamoylase family amidase
MKRKYHSMGTRDQPIHPIDGARIAARLEALWAIAQAPGGGADRPAYSDAEAGAMRLVADWAAEAGLPVAIDAHGNLWALPPGDGPVVTSGSHVDTVPAGGRFDGALGTVLALEAALALPGRVGLLICAAEEAPRFGAGTVGSRLMVGTLPESALDDMRDAAGVTAAEARAAYLAALDDLPRLDGPPPLARIGAHVEVHVELRHELRGRGARLGVVERIAAPHRHELTVEGEAGHAGEVPMEDRHDALAATAEIVLALEAAARAEAERAPATVATVGVLDVEPGAISVIPGRVRAALEVRGIDAAAIATVEAALDAAATDVEARRSVRVTRRLLRGGDPIALDPGLADRAMAAATARGLSPLRTYSGAGHDSGHLAAHVPAALLFVPLAGGQSHTPQEAADDDDVRAAADVLVDVLAAT